MRKRENIFRDKETVESQSEPKLSSKSQESSSFYNRMKNGIGIAFAGALQVAEVTMKVTTAGLAIQAGLGMKGVDGFSAPSTDTELQVRGDDYPSKVPAYIIGHPSQIEKRAQTLRVVAEKANRHPEVARKLLEIWEGKQRQNKGTERLTPDKINPEVWENVQRMLTERELNSNTATPIVFVHGITGVGPWTYGSSAGSACRDGYWNDAINYLSAQGYSDFRTIQYYTGDTTCDIDLQNSAYQSLCDNFSPGSEGTNNEDLNHVSCLLAQYLNQNFAGGQNVILVGHSLGGIIIRNTMYLAETQGGQQGMPSDIGMVTDAVTFNTPHEGVSATDSFVACLGCTQTAQITQGSDFITNLAQNAQNPQTPAGFTQWTVVGSECDPVVAALDNPAGASGALAMQASHAVMYSEFNSATCYDHTQALHDSSTANDATLFSCDTSDPVNSPCGLTYEQYSGTIAAPGWIKTTTGPRGLQVLENAVGQ